MTSVLNIDNINVKYIVSTIDPGTSLSIGTIAGSSIGTTVIGQSTSVSSGSNNTFVGYQCGNYLTPITTGSTNTMIGSRINVTTGNTSGCVSIGDLSVIATNSVAVGWSAYANGTNSVALGYICQTGSNNSIGLGTFAFVTGTNSVGIGYQISSGNDSVVLGNQASAAAQSVAIGSLSQAVSTNSVCIGYNSKIASGTSTQCTVIGSSAGNTSLQPYNVLIGNSSGTGLSNTWNTCIGNSSGTNLASALSNVLIGHQSGVAAGQGSTQTGVGIGYRATLGTVGGPLPIYHLGIGYQATTNASSDVYIGPNIGATFPTGGSGNVIIGLQNGIPITSGTSNIVIGSNSGQNITSGSGNTLIGNSVSALNTGSRNILLGGCGQSITSANDYIGIGSGCWANITTGSANGGIAIGSGSMANATNAASNNVAIGLNAGNGVTTGSFNTCIGDTSGATIGAGNNNTCFGYLADVAGFSNCTAIGNGANNFTGNNQVVLGNGAITNVNAAIGVITNISDMRDKKNIVPLDVGLDYINKLVPVSFIWNKRDGSRVGDLDTGFLAQDLLQLQKETFIPNLVDDTDPEHLMVTPSMLVPILVQALKDANKEMLSLEGEILQIMKKLEIL